MTFPNDQARREYFLEKLREKLKDQTFRELDGFPMGDDDAILTMSDPPYYTACPNPFMEEFVRLHGKPYNPGELYRREPLAVDSSEGKTDPIYTAHGYHTKVPHKAIMRAILHYTSPGDLVLDGFCGSGMTGVAAQMCGNPDNEFKQALEEECRRNRRPLPTWGARKAVLNDLSPAATFIARGYNLPFDVEAFVETGERILAELNEELGWMYETIHTDGKTKGRINYTVWSDIFSCSDCGGEVTFLDEALDPKTKRVKESFPCPHCGAELTKARMDRQYETYLDSVLGKSTKRIKRRPVLINYSTAKGKFEKPPNKDDLALLKKVESLTLPPKVPTNEIPFMHMTHQRARMDTFGITHIHHFYLSRAARALGVLWAKASSVEDVQLRNMLLFFVEQAVWGMSVLARYTPTHYSQVNQYLTGVYYVASQHAECSPWYILEGKLARLAKAFRKSYAVTAQCITTTGTAALLGLPHNSIDYIFTDPPFGENIYYADLNFLVESWHHVWTNAEPEAIVDQAKKKELREYQHLMQRCFEEYYRVLKPGRWMTVVFHNSRNSVWNAIQEAMLAAGFVVADVRTLDKQQGSYRQVTSTAVKQDLVISAYKPNSGLEERFKLEAGTEAGAWDFIKTHLRQLPVFVQSQDGRAEVVAERMGYLLYDRMVAFHVQRGYAVPLASIEFHAGLRQRFPERDGMYFLPEQVSEYDQKRLEVKDIEQHELFVSDEKSAIQWVRRQLSQRPMKYQALQPLYMREAQRVWEKHEQPLELVSILEQNFVKESDGSWRVPDPKKEADLEQVRHRSLMKEFLQYVETKGRLKLVRSEALRAGFKESWQKQDYTTIVQMAKRVPEAVIQEDPALLMYYDNALMRTGE
jgi:hypothetical protein